MSAYRVRSEPDLSAARELSIGDDERRGADCGDHPQPLGLSPIHQIDHDITRMVTLDLDRDLGVPVVGFALPGGENTARGKAAQPQAKENRAAEQAALHGSVDR